MPASSSALVRLFEFLDHPDVPSVDNASELDQRPSVIYLRATREFSSGPIAEVFAFLISRLSTATEHRQGLFAVLHAVGGAHACSASQPVRE